MLELFNTYRGDAQHIASVLLALAIWRWGGGPERWLIGLFIGTMVLPTYLFKLFDIGVLTAGPYAWLYPGFDIELFRRLKRLKAISSKQGKPYRITERGLRLVRAELDNR